MGFADFSAGNGQAEAQQESRKYAYIKGGNVQWREMIAEDAGVGIEKNRDKAGACQQGYGIAAALGNRVWHRHELLKGKIKQHGEKQQFHMFPNGFVDGGKKPCIWVAAAPAVYKMGERSEKGCK